MQFFSETVYSGPEERSDPLGSSTQPASPAMSGGSIVGIVIGALVIVVIVGLIGAAIFKFKRKTSTKTSDVSREDLNNGENTSQGKPSELNKDEHISSSVPEATRDSGNGELAETTRLSEGQNSLPEQSSELDILSPAPVAEATTDSNNEEANELSPLNTSENDQFTNKDVKTGICSKADMRTTQQENLKSKIPIPKKKKRKEPEYNRDLSNVSVEESDNSNAEESTC